MYSEDPTKRVSEFTQQDIYDSKILFKHKGSNFGRILIWVNDGQLWVSTELKVRASAPFVEMENNTGLIVQRLEIREMIYVLKNNSLLRRKNSKGEINFDDIVSPGFSRLLSRIIFL